MEDFEYESLNKLSGSIISAAIEVHRNLGPGLLESVYEECLCHEMQRSGLKFTRQPVVPITYDQKKLDLSFRPDLLIGGRVIVECKAVREIVGLHQAQLLTYLKLTGMKLGLILNFNTTLMKQGIKRMIL